MKLGLGKPVNPFSIAPFLVLRPFLSKVCFSSFGSLSEERGSVSFVQGWDSCRFGTLAFGCSGTGASGMNECVVLDEESREDVQSRR